MMIIIMIDDLVDDINYDDDEGKGTYSALFDPYDPGGSLLGEARRKGLERGLKGEQCETFSCVPPTHYRTPR